MIANALEQETTTKVADNKARWLYHPCGRGGGGGNASSQWTKSESDHKWTQWLCNGWRLGVLSALGRWKNLEVDHKWAGKLYNLFQWATQPFDAGEKNQRWLTSRQDGYISGALGGYPKLGSEKRNHRWPFFDVLSHETSLFEICGFYGILLVASLNTLTFFSHYRVINAFQGTKNSHPVLRHLTVKQRC